SPDGQRLLSGSDSKSALLWGPSLKNDREFSGHTGGVVGVAFSPDGRRLVTAGADGWVIVRDVQRGSVQRSWFAHDRVRAAALSPDGKRLLTGAADGTSVVWDVDTGRKVATLRRSGQVEAVAWAADGKSALTGHKEGGASVWEAATGAEVG